MNMRQNKRTVMALQLAMWADVRLGRKLLAKDVEREIAASDEERRQALAELLVEMADFAPEFQCVKVNGGEVVDTFQTRSEALALVLKHARQKKAKLQVVNTDTGELEVFSEAEMA